MDDNLWNERTRPHARHGAPCANDTYTQSTDSTHPSGSAGQGRELNRKIKKKCRPEVKIHDGWRPAHQRGREKWPEVWTKPVPKVKVDNRQNHMGVFRLSFCFRSIGPAGQMTNRAGYNESPSRISGRGKRKRKLTKEQDHVVARVLLTRLVRLFAIDSLVRIHRPSPGSAERSGSGRTPPQAHALAASSGSRQIRINRRRIHVRHQMHICSATPRLCFVQGDERESEVKRSPAHIRSQRVFSCSRPLGVAALTSVGFDSQFPPNE